MDLSLSEDQVMLGDLVRHICEDTFPIAALRAAERSEQGFSGDLWSALIDSGIAGVRIPATFGGLDLGSAACAVMYEAFGRALASSPHFPSCVLAAGLIASSGDPVQQERWLPAMASGARSLSVASLEPAGDFSRKGIQLTGTPCAEGIRLRGRKHFVPFGDSVDAFIVLARVSQPDSASDRIVAVIVDAGATGIAMVRQANLAGEAHAAVDFDDVLAPAGNILNAGQDIWAIWREAMFESLIPLAAQAVGAAARVHEISVAYAKQREAFGRPIGGFQAIAHDLAEGLVAIRGSRILVLQAAWARDSGRPYHRLAAMAKHQACAAFRKISALAIQVHGGLGYTSDCDVQLYYRRAKQWQILNWDQARLEQEIGDLTLGRPDDRPVEALHV